MPEKREKTYRVANPNGIPEGVRILATEDKEWFEGAAIKPDDVEGFTTLVSQGYIVAVKPRRARSKAEDKSDDNASDEVEDDESEDDDEEDEVTDAG